MHSKHFTKEGALFLASAISIFPNTPKILGSLPTPQTENASLCSLMFLPLVSMLAEVWIQLEGAGPGLWCVEHRMATHLQMKRPAGEK